MASYTLDQVRGFVAVAEEGHFGRAAERLRSVTLCAELVYAEPLVLAAPRDHPLAHLDRPLTLRDVGQFGLVMHSPTGARYLHALVDSEFQRVGIDPNYVHYTNQTHTLLALVDAEVGVGLVPLAATTLQLRNVVYRDIADVDPHGSELYRAWATANDNPALHALLRAIPATLMIP